MLIDTRYFTLAAPRGIATHSNEYRLPSLITRYVRTNRLSTILPLRIAGNTASEAYGSIARAARVAIAPVHPVLSPRLEECEYLVQRVSRAHEYFVEGKKNKILHVRLFAYTRSSARRENCNLHRADSQSVL